LGWRAPARGRLGRAKEAFVDTGALADSAPGRVFLAMLARIMESRLRYRYFGPATILEAAGVRGGLRVLEIGCGTGFFTLPAAELLGAEGQLVSVDVLQASVDRVARRVTDAGFTNVRVLRADALATGLEAHSFDLVLLFGVVPAPTLPLDALLVEIRRVLRDEGELAVWPWIPLWLPDVLVRGARFAYIGRRDGVSRFVTRGTPEAYPGLGAIAGR
jgi:SAM-dependent methyltransferase